MATTKASKSATTPAAKDTAVPPIPVADRGAKPSASASNLLKRFAQIGKVSPKAKAVSTRLELELSDEATKLLKEFGPINELFNLFESRNKTAKDALNPLVWDLYLEVMWKGKGQPQNPEIKVLRDDGKTDVKAMFIAQEKFHVQLPPLEEGESPEEALVKLFVDQELPLADAQRLVAEELDFTPDITINFTRQLYGHQSGKAFVTPNDLQRKTTEKLFMFLQEGGELALTAAERESVVIDTKFSVTVKAGFLQRVCSYVHSKEQLATVLSIIKPTYYTAKVSFAESDSVDNKNARLKAESEEILNNLLGD